jgi:hypothetical protein
MIEYALPKDSKYRKVHISIEIRDSNQTEFARLYNEKRIKWTKLYEYDREEVKKLAKEQKRKKRTWSQSMKRQNSFQKK